MIKPSIFRDFISALRTAWGLELPRVRPIDRPLGPAMPRANTFYAGVAEPLGLHVFINFQHSPLAWNVGSFTINVILSRGQGPPEGEGGPFAPTAGKPLTEGSYRIASLIGTRDKWWALRDVRPNALIEAWRPTSYQDPEMVIAEAVANVTQDVRAVLARLGALTL